MKYNNEAEVNVLGAIIQDNDSICKVIDLLKPTDFYKDSNQIIYSQLKTMYENQKPIDLTTVAEGLGSRLKEVGGITYLSEIITSTISSQNIKAYAEIIKEKSILRHIELTCKQAIMGIREDKKSEEIIPLLQNIETINSNEETGDIKPVLEQFLTQLEHRYNNGGDIEGIKTHYSDIDSILGGLHKQEMIIVGARPSMGKSVFANNLAINIAKDKKKVAVFNLEMNNISTVKRMVASVSKINSYDIRDGSLNDNQWSQIGQTIGYLSTLPIKLYEKTMTLNKILAECKKLKVQFGLEVVIIDYLQLISGNSKESRNQEVSDISRKLKLLAKELDITIIALSQLSRAPEQRTDHRPNLSDLRESGTIEQDADVVMFLYRDEYYNHETEDKGILECIVAKQREGATGTIKLAWVPEYQFIGDLSRITEVPTPKSIEKGWK